MQLEAQRVWYGLAGYEVDYLSPLGGNERPCGFSWTRGPAV